MRSNRASLLLILTACFRPPSVSVIPTRDAPSVSPKPDTCTIDFFESDTLQRPYDVLAEVRVTPASVPAVTPKELMRERACLLGADAVIGLHWALSGEAPSEFVGTAVRYRQK